MNEPMVSTSTNPNWRELVKDIEPEKKCPTCGMESFGQRFYIGVKGFAQECRQCRIKGKTE